MDIIFPYSEAKIKPYLKMAIQRLQIAKNKKITLSKHEKREIGQLLGKQKEELARIKTEHIIREDFTIEAYEMIELLCELVHERIRLISNSDGKTPPEDLREAMATLIWASKRITIEELNEVTNQLRKKFGSKFVDEAVGKSRS
jgi:vacuolar protein sorting-associated protein IST1